MKSKILFILLSILISFQFILGATINIINPTYNFSSNYYNDSNLHEADSVMLRVTTLIDTVCYYNENQGILPQKSFDGNYGTKHEKVLENLGEGIHKYYILCGESLSPDKIMEVTFRTTIPISGILSISKDPPLKEGQYEINLVTSKPCLEEPILEYTFDGITYKQISLKGSGLNWKGYLIILGNEGEVVGSFRFKTTDLAGRQGTKLTGDNVFIIDTLKPDAISIIDAIGYAGQIKLDWFYQKEVKEFNIYKSQNPNVDYTDFYKTSTKNYFTDNDVEKGKTYYYRIAGVDKAENIADLSREIYATALFTNSSGETETGLDIKLVGKVDNLISEIDALTGDIEEIKLSINSKEGKEKELFLDLKLDKEIENSIYELNSLKRDIEKYKLQDLTESELSNKLNSAVLKINIIKKKIPENLVITDEKSFFREISEENIQKALLEYSGELGNNNKKEIDATLDIVKDKNIKITSTFYSLKIVYIDGTRKEITVIKDSLDSEIEILDNFFYVIIIPKDIAEKASEIEIMNLNYDIIKDDPVIAFASDTKKVTYYIEKSVSLNYLENIIVSPIRLIEETPKITGNAISNYLPDYSFGIGILIIFVFAMIIYFIILKRRIKNKPIKEIMGRLEEMKKLIKENKKEEAKKAYSEIKDNYKSLSEKNKNSVFYEIKKINENLIK